MITPDSRVTACQRYHKRHYESKLRSFYTKIMVDYL